MRKIWLLPFLFLLVACGTGGGAPTESQQSAGSDNPVSEAGESSDTASAQSLDNAITIGKNPAEAGVIRDRDWTKGSDDPIVTIIEYGDFQ